MATRKQTDFLDLDHSDENGSEGYNSDIDDLKKGGRSPKRRKVDSDASDNDEPEQAHEMSPDVAEDTTVKNIDLKPRFRKSSDIPSVSKPLTEKSLVATENAIKRSGVIYLSRIPPFMKPGKLRSLIEPYGDVNRIFLSPEDPASHARRVRSGGNKKRSFTDGWVEMVRKKDAKQVHELLNGRMIGGRKGSFYREDLWNIKYLTGFKWNNLTEQIAAENAERASRMRAEISKTSKENKEFVQNVARAKMLEGMESKKAAKPRLEVDVDMEEKGDMIEDKQNNLNRPRYFKQTAVASKKKREDQSEQVKRVLSKIF